ncbi:hypothetical protein EZS27_005943 [termite gut metagenome]|uniref:Uncharacterized protein n=1 Tax=termite gut metagenome TaxID=433724 RepID=A0A5J4SN01_9ZZZZ
MAIPIKSVPTLKGKEAEIFVKKAQQAYNERGSIDLSKTTKAYQSILKKAKI